MPANHPDFKALWANKRAVLGDLISQGKVLIEFNERTNKERFLVAAPYDERFIAQARACNGRWRKRTSRWTFHIRHTQHIVDQCRRIFGKDKVVTRGLSSAAIRAQMEPPRAVDEDSPAPW